jgi:hypothetical protein
MVGYGRVTVRDLLLLVGSVENPGDHVEKIFGWTFTRSSEFVKGAVAGLIAFAVGVAAVLFDKDVGGAIVLGVLAAILLTALAAGALYVNRDISHLHREWLASAALIRRLEPFKDDLGEYLAANAEPDHDPLPTAAAAKAALEESLSKWPPEGTTPQPQIGKLLFAALGPVPTVHYQADRDVRDLTVKLLAKAKGD